MRHQNVKHLVLQILDFVLETNPSLLTFPLNIHELILLFPQYKIWTYQYHAERFNQTLEQTEQFCQSTSGCAHSNGRGNYVILYNSEMVEGRQRWTLAHEFGHCVLSHFSSCEMGLAAENGTLHSIDKMIESEADYFASVLLCPFPICKKLNVLSPEDIKCIFGLSTEAAHYRYSNYLTWKNSHFKTAFDSDVVKYFQPFISSCK